MKTSQWPGAIDRREFLRRSFVSVAASGVCGTSIMTQAAQSSACPPVVVFSKIYQELKLSFKEAALLTSDAGLDGVDCPVRPGGEVLPERVAEDLPRYAEALRKHGLSMPLLTTAILSPSSPNAQEVLRTGKKLGAQYYRLGFVSRKSGQVAQQISELRAQLKDLAVLNRELGLCALVQNHSSSGENAYLAGDLSEMRQILEGFDPNLVGAAFDIGHAIIVHGDGWRAHFDALKSHLKIAYIKDPRKQGGWVRFGEGEIAHTNYFSLLKQLGYRAPFSLHIEFEWAPDKASRKRAALLKALKESSTVLRSWYAGA